MNVSVVLFPWFRMLNWNKRVNKTPTQSSTGTTAQMEKDPRQLLQQKKLFEILFGRLYFAAPIRQS
jgi:hypothetical protein